MTELIRYKYDGQGKSTVLGLPAQKITEQFDGTISAGGVVINDAFYLDELDLSKNNSSNILTTLSQIANIKRQKRYINPTFEVKYRDDSNKLVSATKIELDEQDSTIDNVTLYGAYYIPAQGYAATVTYNIPEKFSNSSMVEIPLTLQQVLEYAKYFESVDTTPITYDETLLLKLSDDVSNKLSYEDENRDIHLIDNSIMNVHTRIVALAPKDDLTNAIIIAVVDTHQYIQDGLVFWLDGLDPLKSEIKWTDKINGYSFYENYMINNPGCFKSTMTKYGYLFPDTETRAGFGHTPQLAFTGEDITAESCFSSTQSACFLFGGGPTSAESSYCVLYKQNNTNFQFLQNKPKIVFPSNVTGVTTLSLNYDQSYANGVMNSSIGANETTANGTTGTGIAVACNGNVTPFHGNLYSIRIYNRRLTAEEQLHNQKVDNARFNLNIANLS